MAEALPRPASGSEHQISHVWEMEGLTVAGERNPEAAADFFGCAGAYNKRHSAVIVGEKRCVDGMERVFGIQEHLAERAARSIGGRE